MPRTRRDPRREITRLALIDKAEAMFADFGVDGVSARQIGTAIGSANTNVVAYHFGSKEALIEEIYRQRLPALERRRETLLRALVETGRDQDVPALMYALWQPVFEQVNPEGRHAYAGFIAGHLRSRSYWLFHAMNAEYPVTKEIGERLRDLLPVEARPLFFNRLTIVFSMVVNALRVIDDRGAIGGQSPTKLFLDAIAMAAAAIVVPIGPPDDEQERPALQHPE